MPMSMSHGVLPSRDAFAYGVAPKGARFTRSLSPLPSGTAAEISSYVHRQVQPPYGVALPYYQVPGT